MGAVFLNGTTLSAIEGLEVDISILFGVASYSLKSTFPPAGSGETEGAGSVTPIPALAASLRLPDTAATAYFGVLGLAGFSVDYPQDNSHPRAPTA